jgi:hypothetical protein
MERGENEDTCRRKQKSALPCGTTGVRTHSKLCNYSATRDPPFVPPMERGENEDTCRRKQKSALPCGTTGVRTHSKLCNYSATRDPPFVPPMERGEREEARSDWVSPLL